MFLYILKAIKAKKFLRKYFTRQRILETDNINKISSVACIVNLDEFEYAQALFSFIEDLNIQDHQFSIIAYTRAAKKYDHSEIPLFSFNDFNWKLNVKDGNAKTFLSNEYDVLINYFTKEKLPLLLLSALTPAKIRFGFNRLNHHYNDIIFKIDTNKDTLFRSELLKYLKVLNKL